MPGRITLDNPLLASASTDEQEGWELVWVSQGLGFAEMAAILIGKHKKLNGVLAT